MKAGGPQFPSLLTLPSFSRTVWNFPCWMFVWGCTFFIISCRENFKKKKAGSATSKNEIRQNYIDWPRLKKKMLLSNFLSNISAWDRHLAWTFENFEYPHTAELELGVWQMHSLCVTDGLSNMVLFVKKKKKFDLVMVCTCSKSLGSYNLAPEFPKDSVGTKHE